MTAGRTGRAIVRSMVVVMAATGFAASASATWYRAETTHFVVYSDTSEANLRKQAADLETFDAVMRRFQKLPDIPEAAFNKVTVYVMPSIDAVETMSGQDNAAGFYVGRVTGSVAFTPRLGWGSDQNALTPRIILFHEYAHHFLLGNYARAYPAWFSEGFAEFASTMIEKDGDYWVGAAAQHRAYALFNPQMQMPAARLFAPPSRLDPGQVQALYARGWLLTHMVEFDPDLRAKFLRYLDLLNTGTPSAKAAVTAFGDLKALDKRMDAYLTTRTLPALRIKNAAITKPEVTVRPLGGGEAALIRLRMTSTRGVDAKLARTLYARARGAAAKYPADAVAQGWLAEMAFDAGELVAAEAAADAALAVDPTQSQALLYKARVHLMSLIAAKSVDVQAWKEARSWIIKANRARADDAAALALFYESFGMQGAPPSKGAVAGLHRAIDLVPQDKGLRFVAARQLLIDNDLPAAREALLPLANDPHAGADNAAARLFAALDAGATGRAALDALDTAAKASNEKKD